MTNGAEHEVHLELLVGRMVVDEHGKRLGRIEEVVADVEDGLCRVQEFHLGARALGERLASTLGGIFSHEQRQKSPRQIVSWADLDLSDPRHPVLKTSHTGRRSREDATASSRDANRD